MTSSWMIILGLFGFLVPRIQANQWKDEDNFCNQLDNLYVVEDKLCHCSYDENNKLALICGYSYERSAESISKELTLVFAVIQNLDQNISLGNLVFTNLTNLTKVDFSNYDRIKVDRLSFIGLPELNEIAISSTMQNTLAHVDIIEVSPNLWSNALSMVCIPILMLVI